MYQQSILEQIYKTNKEYYSDPQLMQELPQEEYLAQNISNLLDGLVMQKGTDIYDMQLHDIIDLSKIGGLGYLPFRYIMRVPGGWIYANYDTAKDIYTDKLFIPFDNDMQKVDLPY